MARSREPLISLLLPTCERCKYLPYALQTILANDAENFEVILSDNFSQDQTREVALKYSDFRVRYFNTGRRLSMCDNFEFALEKARGRYIVAIGDDDAVMPYAFGAMERLIEDYRPSALYWRGTLYHWKVEGMSAPYFRLTPVCRPREMDVRGLARNSVRWGGVRHSRLPRVYHSLVDRSVLDALRRDTGRVFHSTQPDVFLAQALPRYLDRVLDVGGPMTVPGASAILPVEIERAKLSGGLFARKLRQFLAENSGHALHPSLDPSGPVLMNLVADAVLRAMELCPEVYSGVAFNYEAMWAACVMTYQHADPLAVIAARRRIRRFHKFSVAKFICSCGIFRVARLRRRLISHLRVSTSLAGLVPGNIAEFVQAAADVVAPPCARRANQQGSSLCGRKS